MTITCTTSDAAADVRAVLIDARLTPGRHFHTGDSYLFGPPIIFTIMVDLPADVLRQLRAIPNITIR